MIFVHRPRRLSTLMLIAVITVTIKSVINILQKYPYIEPPILLPSYSCNIFFTVRNNLDMVTETKNGRAKRTSHPIIARKIWEAIGSLQSHKKITDIDNIVTELEDKNQINATETLFQIQKCVTDRILIANKIENESKLIKSLAQN